MAAHSRESRIDNGTWMRGTTMHNINRTAAAILFALALSIVSAPLALAERKWRVPRTEHGQPNLQGYWDIGTTTPFQRPTNLGEKRSYTPEEALAVQQKTRDNNAKLDAPVDLTQGAAKAGDMVGQEADLISFERRDDLTIVNGEIRTSLVIDPPNGKLPVRQGFVDYHGQRQARGIGANDGPDTMDAVTRCLSMPGVPSFYPMPWSANLQIVQTKDHVMLLVEGLPDPRIVRLNGKHLDNGLRFWLGDSIGHWEGDSLVVHTINFRPEQSYAFIMRMSEDFEIVERFTPVSKDEMIYRYTVTDAKAYTAPFTVERNIKRLKPDVRLFEVACHEGNYSMSGILAGTRKQEQDAAAKQSSETKR
jgi:hypothetical protein